MKNRQRTKEKFCDRTSSSALSFPCFATVHNVNVVPYFFVAVSQKQSRLQSSLNHFPRISYKHQLFSKTRLQRGKYEKWKRQSKDLCLQYFWILYVLHYPSLSSGKNGLILVAHFLKLSAELLTFLSMSVIGAHFLISVLML